MTASISRSINIQWDSASRISHQISGPALPLRNDPKLWIFAPSPPLLIAHQFGSMKPSHGLITCGSIVDMLFHKRFVLAPINSALKGAKIDFLYTGGPSIAIQFHPQHGKFPNSDSVEEGVRQLINNYTYYVYSQLDEYTQIVFKTMVTIAIKMYFDFIQTQIKSHAIGKGRDVWSSSFSVFSAQLVDGISRTYFVPEGGRNSENDEWAAKQTKFLAEQWIQLENVRDSLFSSMGLH